MEKYLLEVCVDSVESAIAAANGGADRIELCSNLLIGGTTPSLSLFNEIKSLIDIPINILVRPRFGDFYYSKYEVRTMVEDIKAFNKSGANGVVIGCLDENGDLDVDKMNRLISAADGIDITLHRAFDVCRNPMQCLETAKYMGINTILTSGQKANCVDGIDLLKDLVSHSDGKIDIMVGSGLNSSNIKEIASYTKATSFHMSGKKEVASPMLYKKDDVPMGLSIASEFARWVTDEEEVRKAKKEIECFT